MACIDTLPWCQDSWRAGSELASGFRTLCGVCPVPRRAARVQAVSVLHPESHCWAGFLLVLPRARMAALCYTAPWLLSVQMT